MNIEEFKSEFSDEFIDEHYAMVVFLVERTLLRLPYFVSRDDLIQTGFLGLKDALAKFDSTKGVKFKTYAEHRVRGAILDELRKVDPTPRSIRDLEKLMGRVGRELTVSLCRRPHQSEVADKLGVSMDRYHTMRTRAQGYQLTSIEDREAFTAGDRKALLNSRLSSGDDVVNKIEALQKLEMKVANCGTTTRACYLLYYVWGLTQSEIAELFDVTESRICQRIRQVDSR